MGREMENSSARSVMEYSPVACIRRSSDRWRGESLGWRPRSRPLARAHGHAFAGAHPQQVDFELGDYLKPFLGCPSCPPRVLYLL